MQFLRLAHESAEADSAPYSQLIREVFQARAVGPAARNIQLDLRSLLSCHGQSPNRNIHALVAPQTPYIKERWRPRARDGGVGPEGIRVDSWPDHRDLIPGNSSNHEVIP